MSRKECVFAIAVAYMMFAVVFAITGHWLSVWLGTLGLFCYLIARAMGGSDNGDE